MKPISSTTWMRLGCIMLATAISLHLLSLLPVVGITMIALREPFVDEFPRDALDWWIIAGFFGLYVPAVYFLWRWVLRLMRTQQP